MSVAGARTVLGRLVTKHGKPLDAPDGPVTHRFPDAATMAEVDPAELPMPRARAAALVGVATAVADGAVIVDPGADRDALRAALRTLPGIGPWTVEYVMMRAVGDPGRVPRLGPRCPRARPSGSTATQAADRPRRGVESVARLRQRPPLGGLMVAPLGLIGSPFFGTLRDGSPPLRSGSGCMHQRENLMIIRYSLHDGPEGPLLLAVIDDGGPRAAPLRSHRAIGR